MNRNIIVTIDLEKLEGALSVEYGKTRGIFIPYERNSILDTATGKFIRLYMINKTDRFGNPFMVTRSLTKEEREANKKLRFLGNANYEGAKKQFIKVVREKE